MKYLGRPSLVPNQRGLLGILREAALGSDLCMLRMVLCEFLMRELILSLLVFVEAEIVILGLVAYLR